MEDDSLSTPHSPSQLYRLVDSNWFPILLGVSTALVSLTTIFAFSQRPFYIHKDSALFQHAGWWITQGAELYVDIWDLKPPLIYFVTTLLALVSFGNMAVLHVLSIIVAVATIVAGVTLVGVLTHRLTDDGIASLTAGITMFVFTTVYTFPVAGIRPKYFAFLCGVGGLLLAVEDRPFLSGLIGAATAGFWQLGAPIGLLVVAIALQRDGWRAAGRAIGGGLTMTFITVLPFALSGTLIPLFVETVLAPIYGVERYTVVGRLLRLVIELGYGVAVIPMAVYGWGRGLVTDAGEYWWVAVGGVGYLCQIFLEFQGAIELIVLFVFLALGVGLFVSQTEMPRRQSVIAGCIMLLIVTTAYWNAGSPTLKATVEAEYEQEDINNYDSLPPDPEGWPSMQTIYWEQRQPEYCHYRLGVKQQYFEGETGGTLYKSSCGQWPYAEPPAEWLRTTLSPF
jgi:hypothetical protein